ncbi:hypothetical protein FOL47_010906 [Perkinsus chesapeaki]|uniref:Uncharacterized protein n=1 Tax=Perkinsus chesapeaki TaxID=330153 RepID=A0A7J6L1V6_PERCH|nr:hypothetical protein FOL47_010906 [Perkinsus chesapeaki]
MFILQLLSFALGTFIWVASVPFEGRQYCHGLPSFSEERLIFDYHQIVIILFERIHFEYQWSSLEAGYFFDPERNLLALTSEAKFPTGSRYWRQERWDKFVYHPELDGWSIGDEGSRWFKRC